MHSNLDYVMAACIGLLTAYFLSRAPELRSMRLSQFVFIPAGVVWCVYFMPEADEPLAIQRMKMVMCVFGFVFLAIVTAPNLAYYCGVAVSNLLDPQDWPTWNEEIVLRPVRRLIDKDQFSQALAELDELLKTHKPSYEPVLVRGKLLYHFGRVDETVATLMSLIELSQTPQQQMGLMEYLASVEKQFRDPHRPLQQCVRTVHIRHALVLLPTNEEASSNYKEIPAGTFEVVEIFHRHHRWLKLAQEDWGNLEICWNAIQGSAPVSSEPSKTGIFRRIARMHQAVSLALRGKPHLFRQAEARQLFKEANALIRGGDWPAAAPLLQKASAKDPDHYETAYRWVQAVRQAANDAETSDVISRVLKQSRWTENEREMIQKLQRRPIS